MLELVPQHSQHIDGGGALGGGGMGDGGSVGGKGGGMEGGLQTTTVSAHTPCMLASHTARSLLTAWHSQRNQTDHSRNQFSRHLSTLDTQQQPLCSCHSFEK